MNLTAPHRSLMSCRNPKQWSFPASSRPRPLFLNQDVKKHARKVPPSEKLHPLRSLRSKPPSSCVDFFFFFFWRQICWTFSRFVYRLFTEAHTRNARIVGAQEPTRTREPRLPTGSPGPGEEEKGQAMETAAAAAPGKMAAAKSRAGGASHPPLPLVRQLFASVASPQTKPPRTPAVV